MVLNFYMLVIYLILLTFKLFTYFSNYFKIFTYLFIYLILDEWVRNTLCKRLVYF